MKYRATTADVSDWRTIVEPRTGDRITFELTGVETGGELVRARGFLPGHSAGPVRHIHRKHSESFTVLAGQLRVEIGGRTIIVGRGETAIVPAGTAHTFRNDGDEAVELLSEARPAAHFEEGLRALYGLSRDGRMDPINFALAARLGESLPAGPPRPVAYTIVSILAWIGDRLGRDGRFPEYTISPAEQVTSV